MFFVNSRPCNLPQVAKAFNEVYKSYNFTQSAFIFADIQLDTNAYDVNVSPDKRTIMLHDQTALLESLKEALLKLFEGHDQSVPQAQISGKKTAMSAFRTPTLMPRDSAESAVEDGGSEPEDAPVVDVPSRHDNKRARLPSQPTPEECVITPGTGTYSITSSPEVPIAPLRASTRRVSTFHTPNAAFQGRARFQRAYGVSASPARSLAAVARSNCS
jgi:DNA mismatch repair ATPase MutL